MTAPRPLSSWNWALAAAAIVLIGMTCMPPPALGQDETPKTVGPTVVVSFSGEALELGNIKRPHIIDLKGKVVSVVDSNDEAIAASEVVSGARVTVSTQGSKVQIMVMPRREVKENELGR